MSPEKKSKKNVKKKGLKAKPKKTVMKGKQTALPAANNKEAKPAKSGRTIQPLRGMKDIIPKDEIYWRTVYQKAEELSNAYGFSFMETPVLEEMALFLKSIGRDTDVVEKEMYVFEDKDGTRVALRPEWTAGAARAYISHGMHTWSQPVKVWNYGPVFRHDRPQAGRFRQFHQFGCETMGDRNPCTDAELVAVAYHFLRDLGLQTNVYINSIGNLADRQNYAIELTGFLRNKRSYLCENCKKRISKNPLRVLDCKEESCAVVVAESPQIIDWLSDISKSYFMKVLECLDELEVPYILKSTLVRGLDYYTDTVFELYEEAREGGAQSALGGGGRYDGLIEQLGGPPTPAAGFALGLERVISALKSNKDNKKYLAERNWSGIFFAQLGEKAHYKVLKLIEIMRKQGIVVGHNLAKSSLKAQMEAADKASASHTLIMGQKEVHDGTIIIRDMDSGNQEIVDQTKIVSEVKKIIKGRKSRR